jgi:hypothetical protein
MHTEWPIGRQPHEVNMPFPVDEGIDGLPTEGALISMKPLIVPTRADWVCGEESIGRNQTSSRLTPQEVGKIVTSFIETHSPHFPSIAFAVVFAETDTVEARLPIVSEMAFPALLIEGEELTFTRILIPDREGPSEIYVERSISPSQVWTRVTELRPGHLTYTPTAEDVGNYLRIAYTPVGRAAQRGPTVFSYSESRVRSCLPTFVNPVIAGFPKTNFQLAAIADYKGGRKGTCAFNWYFSRKPFTADSLKKAQLVCESSQYFTPATEHAGGYLAVEMLPVREDGVVGEAVIPALPKPLLLAEPLPPLEDAPTEAIQGERIELTQTVSFMISNTQAFCGFSEVRRGQSFVPSARHVGHILRIITDENDHIVGEVQPAIPVCRSLSISCIRAEVGVVATAEMVPPTIFPEQCEVIWIKTQGGIERAVAFGTREYTFAKEDIGFQMKVRVTPISVDRKLQPFTESALTASVQPAATLAPMIRGKIAESETIEVDYSREADQIVWLRSGFDKRWVTTKVRGRTYTIQTADLGHFLRAELTIGGSVLVATSTDAVQPKPPSVRLTASSSTAKEGEVLTPGIVYFGGKEGTSRLKWTRTLNEQSEEVSTERTYRVTKFDTGAILEFAYTPIRSDKKVGQTVAIRYGSVEALPPTVKNVKLRQNDEGRIEVTGDYSGGVEGESRFEWSAVHPAAGKRGPKTVKLRTTTVPHFAPPPELVGCDIGANYVPIRADGVKGTPVAAPTKVTVRPLPVVEAVELVSTNGEFSVGIPIRCNASIRDGTPSYEWFRGHGEGDWQKLADATFRDYLPTHEDLGFLVCCRVEPVSEQGWRGKAVTHVITHPIDDGVHGLVILAHKSRFQTGVELTTNAEGEVTWERERNGDWEIAAENKATYFVTWNDVGHKLRIFVGDQESQPCPPIVLRPSLNSYVRACVRSKTFKFTITAKVGKGSWVASATDKGITLKGTGGEKIAKWESITYVAIEDTRNEFVLWLDPSSKFLGFPSFPADQRLTTALGEHVRDFVCAVLTEYSKGIGPESP